MMKTNNSKFSLDATIKSFLQDLQEKVKITGAATGERNLPELTGDSFAPLFEEYHHKSQDLIDKVSQQLLPKTTVLEANNATDTALKEHQKLANKVLPLKHKQQEVEAKLKEIHPNVNSKLLLIVKIAIGIICLAEGIFNIPIFQSWGLNLLESIFLGLLFAGVLAIYAHVVPWVISLGKTIWQRRLIILFIFTLTFALFWYLGDMRAQYLSNAASSEDYKVTFSSWPFALASILLMILAIALPIMYYPSKEEMALKRERQALLQEKRAIAKDIALVDRSITAVEGQKIEVHTSSAISYETGYSYEQQIISNAYQCWTIFKNTNLLHRADRKKPDCQNEAYPFTFQTYFQAIHQQTQILQS